MNKKVIIIIVAVSTGVLALGIGFYFAWMNYQNQTLAGPGAQVPQGQNVSVNVPISSTPAAQLSVISKNDVLGYWIPAIIATSSASSSVAVAKQGGQPVFYVSQSGSIYKITDQGEQTVSDLKISDLQSAIVSPDGNKVILKSASASGTKFDIYDSVKNMWQPSLAGVTAAGWSPDSKKIVYLKSNGINAADLTVVDMTTSKIKTTKIMAVNQIDFDLKWIEANRILLIPKSSADFQSQIWNIDISAKTISLLMTSNSLMVGWAKSGSVGLLFSAVTARNYALNLIDGKGNITGALNFKTFPDKCFIAGPTMIYCAIPQDSTVFSRSDFPDDYVKRSVYFNDAIYRADLANNKFNLLFSSDNPVIDAVNLAISANGLFFINRYDNKLYRLTLPQ